jgi:hypothetical protein
MAITVAKHLLYKHVAPGLSEFTSADIPDMSQYDKESAHWINNHFLNNILRGSLQLPAAAAYVYNFLRRAEGAFGEHAVAREATHRFLRSDRRPPSLYASALLHWEFFLGQSWQGYALLLKSIRILTGDKEYKFFSKGDGVVEERLCLLYNSMKHVESRIEKGQILEGASIPVWLTNQGIACTDGLLTFAETAEVLSDLARWSNIVVDPLTMAEKLQADTAA